MKDLFTPLTRDERQEESLQKWLKAKGKGTVVAGTGVGFFEAVTPIMLLQQKVFYLFLELILYKYNYICLT